MRAYLPKYELRSAPSLHETLELLSSAPDRWKPFAGGTDIMVLFEAGQLTHTHFLNLWHLHELRGIQETATHLTIGALSTYSDVRRNATARRGFPMMCLAAAETGALAIQNRGTLGGNIANGSPAADTPPALLAYDAEVELRSVSGSRWIKYDGFHTGYKKSKLAAGELITAIRLPRPSNPKVKSLHFYRKVGTRKAQAISKVCFSAYAVFDGDKEILRELRIALGSVAPIPIRAKRTESFLLGKTLTSAKVALAQAKQELAGDIAPIDDIRSTSEYRLAVSGNLLGRATHPLMWNWISKLEELRKSGTPATLVTVTQTTGSSPREPGAKMLVLEDGRFFGTIGGGNLEQLALRDAQDCLGKSLTRTFRYPLGAKTGQCCGGTVDLMMETVNTGPTLYVFGAGHVGQAVCRSMVGTPFTVHVVDDRPEWIESSALPMDVVRHACEWDEFAREARWDSKKTHVVVMTHRHDVDQEIVASLVDRPIKYLGLIGSESKWARFQHRLTARGVSPDSLSKVRCPIGLTRLGRAGKAPQEIALSLGAELLQLHYA